MAFQTESERILAGSLNLNLPGDQVPAGDAVALENWRADGAGVLRTRYREAALAGYAYVAPVRSLFLRQGNPAQRYASDRNSTYNGATKLGPSGGDKPTFFASYAGYCWMMSQNAQQRTDGVNVYAWTPAAPAAAPSAAAGAAGLPSGKYSYYYSYVTADGIESNLSPGVDVTLTSQQGGLSNIAPSLDASTAARWVYRSGGTQDQLYRVGTINDNTTTTFLDNMSDLAAAALGITHTLNHDPAPAAAGVAGPYYDRLIAWNTAAHPNWIYWTPIDQPYYFPGVLLTAGNHAPVGDDGEAVVFVSIKPNMAIIYKERSIWRLTGDPDNLSGDLERIATEVGLSGPKAICSAGALDFFRGPEGIYVCDGDSARKVSQKLDPLFKGDSYQFQAGVLPALGMNLVKEAIAASCMANRNGRIYYSYCDTAAAPNPYAPNATLVWEKESGKWAQDTRGFAALHDEGQQGVLLGAMGASLTSVEAAQTGAIAVSYTTHTLDQGKPRNAKTYADLEVESDLGGGSLDVTALYDFGAASASLGTLTSKGRSSQTFPFPFDKNAKNISLKISGSLAGEGILYAAHLRYRLEQRDALTFDTGPLNLFAHKWGELAEFALEIATTGDVTWTLYSDIGGDLEQVETGILKHGGLLNRRGVQIPFALIRAGKCFRLAFTAAAPFRLYGLRLRARPVGLYMVAGSHFGGRAESAGSNQVKLLRKFEIETEGAGSLTVTVLSDVPGGRLTQRSVAAVTVGPRGWAEIKLPANARGRLFQCDWLLTSGNAVVYGARMWLKHLGIASSGAPSFMNPSNWTFHPVPVEETPALFSWIDQPVDS